MTDTLRDLLHESVADADMPDLADATWRAGGRARRRRAAGAVAGVAAVALAVGGVVWAADQRDGRRAAEPVHSPSPSQPTVTGSPYDGRTRHDAVYHGTAVWWAPSVAQERSLAYATSPFPTTIDLSSRATLLAEDPVPRVLAAFTLVGDSGPSEVLVLVQDGSLRRIPLTSDDGSPSPVAPMRDPAQGGLHIRAGASMLSPSGEYLMFPQEGSIRLLRLRDNRWSTVDTGSAPTWDATWADGSTDRIVVVDPNRPYDTAPVYDVTGARVAGGPRATDFLNPRFGDQMYGLPRRSPNGSLAQSHGPGADVPQPPALHLSPRQSDWIGVASGPDAILVLPQDFERQKQCCQVAGWIDSDVLLYESRSGDGLRLLAWQQATGNFWQVSQVVGWPMGEVSVVSSYARLPVAGALDACGEDVGACY